MCDIQQPRPPPSSPTPTTTTGTDAADATHCQEQAAFGGGSLTSSADGDNGGANTDVKFQEGGKERSVMDKYMGFRKAVATMGLERAWDMAPLVRVSKIIEIYLVIIMLCYRSTIVS